MFAIYRKPRNGEPWTEMDDAYLLLDFKYGTDLDTMAKRALRTEEEVLARLQFLGCDMSKPRKLRGRDRMIGH